MSVLTFARDYPQFGRSVWNTMRTREEVFGCGAGGEGGATLLPPSQKGGLWAEGPPVGSAEPERALVGLNASDVGGTPLLPPSEPGSLWVDGAPPAARDYPQFGMSIWNTTRTREEVFGGSRGRDSSIVHIDVGERADWQVAQEPSWEGWPGTGGQEPGGKPNNEASPSCCCCVLGPQVVYSGRYGDLNPRDEDEGHVLQVVKSRGLTLPADTPVDIFGIDLWYMGKGELTHPCTMAFWEDIDVPDEWRKKFPYTTGEGWTQMLAEPTVQQYIQKIEAAGQETGVTAWRNEMKRKRSCPSFARVLVFDIPTAVAGPFPARLKRIWCFNSGCPNECGDGYCISSVSSREKAWIGWRTKHGKPRISGEPPFFSMED